MTIAPPTHTGPDVPQRDPRAVGRPHRSLALWQVNLLRVGYLVVGVGLAIVKWPALFSHLTWSLAEGAKECILIAMSVLALLGLRHPTKLLPLLILEVGWKLLWLGVVALPAWRADSVDPAMANQIVDVLWVGLIIAVVPWPYAVRTYLLATGEPWRRDDRTPMTP